MTATAAQPSRRAVIARPSRRTRAFKHDNTTLTLMDWFCGVGGSSSGAHAVPDIEVWRAANHCKQAIASHRANFPNVRHYRGDIRAAQRDGTVDTWEICDILWASPECTNWSIAKGKKRDFDAILQGELFAVDTNDQDEEETESEREKRKREEDEEASRALMEEVPLYLRGVQKRGGLVKAGVVENVIDVRRWHEWDRWMHEIRKLGYHTKLSALNSMHVEPRTMGKVPQSRDRLYVLFWHASLGRTPNWEKWIAPTAWCTVCEEWVKAKQVFKRPGVDMGRYRSQYLYRCPNNACLHQVVEPTTLPAAAAIDFSVLGKRIGDRAKPLRPKTMRRIQAGMNKFARPVPMMVPTGGTWREGGTPLTGPMPARTTRENDGIAIPPLVIPVEGRDGKHANTTNAPLRAQTTRAETGLAHLPFDPFIAEMRGGGSTFRHVQEPMGTVTAGGNHHGLVIPETAMIMRNNGSRGDGGEHCTPVTEPVRTLTTTGHQSLVTWEHFLLPYYSNGTPRSVNEPMGALSTRDRFAVVEGMPDIEDVLFRMLMPAEVGAGMGFTPDYTVLGSNREKVKGYGNAVTPPVAEVLICALRECITGEDLDRHVSPDHYEPAA